AETHEVEQPGAHLWTAASATERTCCTTQSMRRRANPITDASVVRRPQGLRASIRQRCHTPFLASSDDSTKAGLVRSISAPRPAGAPERRLTGVAREPGLAELFARAGCGEFKAFAAEVRACLTPKRK